MQAAAWSLCEITLAKKVRPTLPQKGTGMSASNYRIKDYNTFHHLTSRIAHRVYFLKDEERNDFMEMMLRVSEFTGIKLVGWCLLQNHFHILAYLPTPPTNLPTEEIIRRYGLIKGAAERDNFIANFNRLNQQAKDDERSLLGTITRLRSQMYNIGWFMKLLKQWFTEDYNSRNGHCGTMWEATYHDRVLAPEQAEDLRDCLAYIHLNPIRAAITPNFDDYHWSSLTAFKNGDARATAGMHIAYGDSLSNEEILCIHHERMNCLLESYKRKRAEEIARKRAAGFALPADTLTDEAAIAQAAVHLATIQREVVEMHAKRDMAISISEKKQLLREELALLLTADPGLTITMLAERVCVPERTVYRHVREIRKSA